MCVCFYFYFLSLLYPRMYIYIFFWIPYWPWMLINILWRPLDANQYGRLSLRSGSIFSCYKGLWDVFLPKPITTKHQSVFWLVSQSRRMSAICVGICRWISFAAASADPVVVSMFIAFSIIIRLPISYGRFLSDWLNMPRKRENSAKNRQIGMSAKEHCVQSITCSQSNTERRFHTQNSPSKGCIIPEAGGTSRQHTTEPLTPRKNPSLFLHYYWYSNWRRDIRLMLSMHAMLTWSVNE